MERRELTDKEKEHRKRRLKSIDDCVTIDQFVENMFPPIHDSSFGSWPSKREYLKKRIALYAEYSDERIIKNLSEELYRPEWDEPDGLFQDLREHFVKWIKQHINVQQKSV